MESFILALVFLVAVAVPGAVVYAFSDALDGVIGGIVEPGLASAWSRYARFALFVTGMTGGLRLMELPGITQQGAATSSRALIEVFKTMAGCLTAGMWTLLAIMGGCLAAYAGLQAYGSLRRTRLAQAATERKPAVPAGHF